MQVLQGGKNIQFINCLPNFRIYGGGEDILVQNPKPDDESSIVFNGGMKNIVIRDCQNINEFIFKNGAFSNVSMINCKHPIVEFENVNLNNLLIKNSTVAHLTFDKSDVGGDNRIEDSTIWGNFYGKSKVRDLTIVNCTFEDYVDIVVSELIRLRLVNNTYKIQESGEYEGEVRHRIKEAKYTDSDKFPLKSTPFPEDTAYIKYLKELQEKESQKK